jgi:hypothetical protein
MVDRTDSKRIALKASRLMSSVQIYQAVSFVLMEKATG